MNLKRLLFLIIIFAFIFTGISRPLAQSNYIKVDNIVEKLKKQFEKYTEEEKNNPNFILKNSFELYKQEFNKYLDITGLNVENKSNIGTLSYNPKYKAPSINDILLDYQKEFLENLNEEEKEKYYKMYDLDPDFRDYLKFVNLKNDVDIFKKKNNFNILSVNKLSYEVENDSLMQKLTVAGLSATAIFAIATSIKALGAALSVSYIPVIGWGLAALTAIGAITTITVVLIQNWNIIKNIFEEIKNYFVEKFNNFAGLITDYFGDVAKKGYTSTVVSSEKIGDKTFDFAYVKAKDVAAHKELVLANRRTKNVILIKNVDSDGMFVALMMPVSVEFCALFKTHLLGFSSYTWYQNTARQLIIRAGSGFTSHKPEVHLQNYNNMKLPPIAFKHFHNYDMFGKRIEKPKIIRKVHSFFGLIYFSPNLDGIPLIHPESPKN